MPLSDSGRLKSAGFDESEIRTVFANSVRGGGYDSVFFADRDFEKIGADYSISINEADAKYLRDTLNMIAALVDKRTIDKVINETMSQARDIAENRAPILTGNLRDNIEFHREGDSFVMTSVAIDEVSGKDYAPLQEFGGYTSTGGYVQGKHYMASTAMEMFETLEETLIKTAADVVRRKGEFKGRKI